MPLALSGIDAHQGGGRLLTCWVVVQTGLPGRYHGLGAGVAGSPGAVPCQGEARLLTESLQVLPGPQCPLGVRLVSEQARSIGQSSHETIVAALARDHGQRRDERLFVGFQVDVHRDRWRYPDMTQVGLEETGYRFAELGEDTSGERESLGERSRACVSVKAGEQLLASEVAADAPPVAQEDELAKALGGGSGPRAGSPAVHGDGERAEQVDGYDIWPWRVLASFCGGGHGHIFARPFAATPREQPLFTLFQASC